MDNCKHKWRYVGWSMDNRTGRERHIEWCRKCGTLKITGILQRDKPQYFKPEVVQDDDKPLMVQGRNANSIMAD